MSVRARIITSPAGGGEEITFLTGRRSAAGERVRARVRMFGAGRGARQPQVELSGEKRLTVVRGRMAITCNGKLSVLEAGESIAVAPGVEHAWWSTRAGELCVEVEAAPEAFGLPVATVPSRRRLRAASGARRLTVRIAT
ncbi:MAG TPA: hypothetical protein VNT03_14280 [Baekduia sp.]|nr:hypothetical protein [Baekduia sp.]